MRLRHLVRVQRILDIVITIIEHQTWGSYNDAQFYFLLRFISLLGGAEGEGESQQTPH